MARVNMTVLMMTTRQGDLTSERDLLRWVKKAIENDDIEEVILTIIFSEELHHEVKGE